MTRHRNVIIDMELTGANIKRLMNEKGYSISLIIRELHLSSPQAVYSWFKGYTIPSIDNFVILSKILDVPIDELIVTKETFERSENRGKIYNTVSEIRDDDYDELMKIAKEYDIPFSKLLYIYGLGYMYLEDRNKLLNENRKKKSGPR